MFKELHSQLNKKKEVSLTVNETHNVQIIHLPTAPFRVWKIVHLWSKVMLIRS